MAWHLCASALHPNPLWDGTGFPLATLSGKVVLVQLQSKEGAGEGHATRSHVSRSVDFILSGDNDLESLLVTCGRRVGEGLLEFLGREV